MSDFSGFDVLITGGPGVIGQAVARRLGRERLRLHLCIRDPKKLAALRKELAENSGVEAQFYTADLRNTSRAEQVVGEFFANSKRPFGLVCLAGHYGKLGPFSATDWQ